MTQPRITGLGRWLRFNAVGLMGFALQLVMLTVLIELARMHYLWATIAAVEAAILHNFLWHERWTWKDRRRIGRRGLLRRLVKFNGSTGLVSIAGNAALMAVYVGWLGLPPVPANVLAVASCALVNFLVNDRFVFTEVPGETRLGSVGCR